MATVIKSEEASSCGGKNSNTIFLTMLSDVPTKFSTLRGLMNETIKRRKEVTILDFIFIHGINDLLLFQVDWLHHNSQFSPSTFRRFAWTVVNLVIVHRIMKKFLDLLGINMPKSEVESIPENSVKFSVWTNRSFHAGKTIVTLSRS